MQDRDATLEEQIVAASELISTSGPEILGERYERLADLLESADRTEEAVVASLAGASHTSEPGAKQRFAARAASLRGKIASPGLLAEHDSVRRHLGRFDTLPSFIRIETTAQCNAACVFCPYPDIDRKGTRMPDAMIDKLLRDLADIPPEHRFGISFHHMSEPFIDKRFPSLVARVAEEIPNASVMINTNASALNERNLAFICDATNISEINISFNDHRREFYELSMSIPYDRTLRNIDSIHEAVQAGRLKPKVIVRRVGDGTQIDTDFVSFCAERWPKFYATSKLAKDFLGQIKFGPTKQPIGQIAARETAVMACSQWFQMTITTNGDLAVCCFDGMAKWVIGNVSNDHVLDIYNSPAVKRYRDSVTRLEAPAPCNSCSIYWSGARMNTADYRPQA